MEMLSGVGGLLHGGWILTLDDEPIEIFPQQNGDGFRHRAHHPVLDVVDFVQNSQSPVLKDWVGIQYEEPGFHKCASKGKK